MTRFESNDLVSKADKKLQSENWFEKRGKSEASAKPVSPYPAGILPNSGSSFQSNQRQMTQLDLIPFPINLTPPDEAVTASSPAESNLYVAVTSTWRKKNWTVISQIWVKGCIRDS